MEFRIGFAFIFNEQLNMLGVGANETRSLQVRLLFCIRIWGEQKQKEEYC